MIDDRRIERFMDGFLGYGNGDAPLWFIGMEEGGGNSVDEIALRIATWEKRGHRRIEDLKEYHACLSDDFPTLASYFVSDRKAPLQGTWRGLIRILLQAKGLTATPESIREYQVTRWGRTNGEVRLLNLLPLPAPSINHWPYADCTALPELQTRRFYKQVWEPRRIEAIRQAIRLYGPRDVVMFGLSNIRAWDKIAGGKLERHEIPGVWYGSSNGARYWAIHHTTRVKSKNLDAVGRCIGRYDKCDGPDYSIYGFLSAGARFTWGFGPEDAIRRFLEIYPYADEASVRLELTEELAKHGDTFADWASYVPASGE